MYAGTLKTLFPIWSTIHYSEIQQVNNIINYVMIVALVPLILVVNWIRYTSHVDRNNFSLEHRASQLAFALF